MASPQPIENTNAAWTAVPTSRSLWAPHSWATTMEAPVERPTKKFTSRRTIEFVESMAPRATEPTKLPTTNASMTV